jgi:ribose transport system ATP-binding protein
MSQVDTVKARLDVRDASKTFGRTKVLDGVSFQVAPGEIHGLIGQNGSGKSTVLKLLSGFHRADVGTGFAVDGQEVSFPVEPHHLHHLGVSFVHQDLGLDDRSTIVDNIRIGRFRTGRFTRSIDFRAEREMAAATLARLGSELDPTGLVGELQGHDRSLVAIARALQGHAPGQGCILFDESTQSLPRASLADFYAIVRDLAAGGTSIVLVSHRLDEVLALTDRVTVLRDGRLVATVDTALATERSLTTLMLGQDADRSPLQDEVVTEPGAAALVVENLSGLSIESVSFSVRHGEVVGITGRPESGYEEIPVLLSGSVGRVSGTLRIDGKVLDLAKANVRTCMTAGLAYVPESRARDGLALQLSQLENLTAPRLDRRSRRWWVRDDWQRQEFEHVVSELGITPVTPDLPAATLSGGNQQKLLLGKWLHNEPSVLVTHEPTQAVDVGARRDILRALRRAAQRGAGVVVASVEAVDLAAACDRVLIVAGGRVVDEVRAPFDGPSLLDRVYPVPLASGVRS